MWQKVVNRAIVPLLFAVVVSVVAIDLTLYSVVHRKDVSALAIESEKGLISQYDDMFRRVGRAYDIDWLLLSAIARTESEFYSKAVSKAGAVGIMQVMPSVARAMGYEPELLYDPEICEIYAFPDSAKGQRIGQRLAALTGYELSRPASTAAYTGLCDYTSSMGIPSFTIELGKGVNPLPESDIPEIFGRVGDAMVILPTLL